jgi:hypothetical protein
MRMIADSCAVRGHHRTLRFQISGCDLISGAALRRSGLSGLLRLSEDKPHFYRGTSYILTDRETEQCKAMCGGGVELGGYPRGEAAPRAGVQLRPLFLEHFICSYVVQPTALVGVWYGYS